MRGKREKICLVCSSGGHLFQLYLLKEWWKKHPRVWVSFKKADTLSLLKGEKIYWAYFPTTRNLWNLLRNTLLAMKVFIKEKPWLVVSTGAGVAVPFFWLGKIFGAKTVYIEVYDRINSPTLTGRLVYPVTDLFVLQWEEQKRFYPKGVVLGGLL